MKVVVLMHVGKTLKRLKHDVPDLMLTKKPPSFFHDLVDIHVKILKNEVQGSLFQYDFVELDYIWV